MAICLTTGSATVIAGTTPDMSADLYDNDGTALTAAQITSLTLTIHDDEGNVINSRSDVDINDTGIGSLVDGASTVTLTIKPVSADTAYQGDDSSDMESHYWKIKWGWNDGDGDARIGGEIYKLAIERLPAA